MEIDAKILELLGDEGILEQVILSAQLALQEGITSLHMKESLDEHPRKDHRHRFEHFEIFSTGGVPNEQRYDCRTSARCSCDRCNRTE